MSQDELKAAYRRYWEAERAVETAAYDERGEALRITVVRWGSFVHAVEDWCIGLDGEWAQEIEDLLLLGTGGE